MPGIFSKKKKRVSTRAAPAKAEINQSLSKEDKVTQQVSKPQQENKTNASSEPVRKRKSDASLLANIENDNPNKKLIEQTNFKLAYILNDFDIEGNNELFQQSHSD
jgi:hypothetical protein